jgi:hypothetical protein
MIGQTKMFILAFGANIFGENLQNICCKPLKLNILLKKQWIFFYQLKLNMDEITKIDIISTLFRMNVTLHMIMFIY